MNFPLYMKDFIGYQGGLVMGTLIGFGFGFVLERAGFGRAPVLAAQFYGSDMRVFKVMFTAILTALVGMTLLAGVGILDLSALSVPETFLWPQLCAGLVFGVGFIVSGYCPGTSVVAAASGNLDGLFAFLGVIAGSLVFGGFYEDLATFYQSSAMGVFRLTDLLGVSQAALTLAIVLMAICAFFAAERVEVWLARRRSEEAPPLRAKTRNRVLGGVAFASILGMAVLLVPPGPSTSAPGPVLAIDSVELARAILEQTSPIYVVDLRDRAECEKERIPGAMCVPEDDPKANFLALLPPTRRLVLYREGELDAIPVPAERYGGEVLALRGGFTEFKKEILSEPEIVENPTPEEISRYRLLSALYAYFTGAGIQKMPTQPQVKPVQIERSLKKGGGC